MRERLSLLNALVEWAELSPEDVQLRVSAGFPCKAERAGGQPTVRIRWKDGDTTDLGLYSDFDETVCCTLVPDGKENRPMTEEERETLRRTFRQARLAGLRTCFLLSSGTEGVCLEGMLAYGPHTCRKTDGAIRALEADGIRVTAFLHDVTEENARVLSECGITSGAPSNRPQSGEPRTPAVTLLRGAVPHTSWSTSARDGGREAVSAFWRESAGTGCYWNRQTLPVRYARDFSAPR